jgi:hypothetical protein
MVSRCLKAFALMLIGHSFTIDTVRLTTATSDNTFSIEVKDKTYFPGEEIKFTLKTSTPIDRLGNDWLLVTVVSSTELGSIETATDYIDYYIPIEQTSDTMTFSMHIYYDMLLEPTKGCTDVAVTTDVKVIKWGDIPPFHIVLLNDDGTKIAAKSDPLRIRQDDIDIKLVEKSYFPGEALNWKFSTNQDLRGIQIFEVPTSYKNDPSQFNKARVVKWYSEWTGRRQIIDWTKPGLYQAVAISRYGQIIRGVSPVFKVKAEGSKTKTTVEVNDNDRYLDNRELVTYKITRKDGAPYETELQVYLVEADNDNPTMDQLILAASGKWKKKSDTIELKSYFPSEVDDGIWYKAIVDVHGSDGDYRLGISNSFKVQFGGDGG